jgi:hypothetical protein
MARRNGEPGRDGISIALIGLAVGALGLFMGAELNGLAALGYGILLGGFLTTLFGVLREVTDRVRH